MPHLTPRPGWKRWLPRSPSDLGKREQMLTMLGLIWVMIGLSTLDSDTTRAASVLHEHIPRDLRGWTWVITGCVAIVAAWRPRGTADWLGWAALYIMPTLRVVSYTLAWAASWTWLPLDDLPLTDAYDDGWRFAVVYLAQSLTVVICAGWANPATYTPHEDDTQE